MMAATRAPTARQPFGPIDALRVLLYTALLVTALVAPGGRYLFVLAGAIVVASIALNVSRTTRPISLISVWELGFFLLIVLEGTFTAHDVIAEVSGSAYGTASRFLIAANCMVVIGHAVVYRAARFRTDDSVVWRFRPDHTALFLFSVSTLYYLIALPWVLAVLRSGRNIGFSFGPGATAPLVEGFVMAAGLALPSFYVFAFTRVRRGSIRPAVLLSLPILAAHFIVGTRFPMLFAVGGMFITRFGNEQLRVRTWVRAGVLLFVIALAMSMMVQFRGKGASNVDPGEVITELVADGLDTSEEIVLTQARMVDHYGRQPHLEGRSTSSLFVFWVPRALWPGKPTLLEHWFPREYGLRGFPESHSIAAGFPADGYADFGFAGGLLTMLIAGLGLGAIDRASSRVLVDRGSPYLCLVGPLYGAVFFAVRSMNTAIIAALGVVVLAALFSRATGAHRVRIAPDESADGEGDVDRQAQMAARGVGAGR